MSHSDFNILGVITPEHFLKTYWQKKPLLIRQAIPDYQCPVTPEELAGLAGEDGVESRLVIEKDGKHPWQVKHGPLTKNDFKKLPASHWTLLVQRVDHYDPRIASLLDLFRFIQNWRIDDVMISYAPEHGSAGPHLDSYDVFLLQGMGKRRWQINLHDYTAADFIPGLDLRILKEFRPEEEWILEPGDLLYLPPGIAHHGVALEPGLTLSIGFLAPARSELITHFVEEKIAGNSQDTRYTDADLLLQQNPGEITAHSLARIRELMTTAFNNEAMIGHWFGRFITGQHQDAETPSHASVSVEEFSILLGQHRVLYRNGGARCVYINNESSVSLFVNGAQYNFGTAHLPLVRLITDGTSINIEHLNQKECPEEFKTMLCELYNRGAFRFDCGLSAAPG